MYANYQMTPGQNMCAGQVQQLSYHPMAQIQLLIVEYQEDNGYYEEQYEQVVEEGAGGH